MSAVSVHLYLGYPPWNTPAPAPRVIAEAFSSLTVTQTDSGVSSGWQLALRADRTRSPANDAAIVDHPLLRPFSRLIASVSMGAGIDHVLLDGVITNLELAPALNGQGAMLTITGDSVDALMDLKDHTVPWPAMTDAVIVGEVLLPYMVLGLVPQISVPIPPAQLPDPLEGCVVQNESDAVFLRRLASRYGYVFYVKPGPMVGQNTAHWGPPPRTAAPQPALSVDMGSRTNVEALSFNYNAKGPTMVFGSAESEFLGTDVPVATTLPTRLPSLSKAPAILSQLPFVDFELYKNPAFGPALALYEANAITHRSTDRVVVAQGSVDTVRYGHVFDVPGTVGVRGSGETYDGLYYVNSVTHHLEVGTYTQQFELSREGTGSTVAVVPV